MAGAVAGACSTSLLHPLDLWKVHLQANAVLQAASATNSSLNPFRSLFGFFSQRKASFSHYRAYQGYSANLLAASASWGLYFFWYGLLKAKVAQNHHHSSKLSSFDYFWTASAAGLATCLCTNPLWCIRTRMLLQNPVELQKHGGYPSVGKAFMRILREEGVAGLYRGLTPALVAISHGGIQFCMYERLKLTCKDGRKPTTLEYLVFSTVAKCLASTATLPTQVVRSRLQMRGAAPIGVLQLIKQIAQQEGIRGFFRGLVPNTLRVLPSTLVTFVVYERVSEMLKECSNEAQ